MEIDTSPESSANQESMPVENESINPEDIQRNTSETLDDVGKSMVGDSGNGYDMRKISENDNLDLNAPFSSSSPLPNEENANSTFQRKDEEEMEYDNKNDSIDYSQNDYEMKSPVSRTENVIDDRSDFSTDHDVNASQTSDLDVCNRSTDIEDKMDALSDLKDSDLDTSQPTESEDVQSDLNESLYKDEKDITLVEQEPNTSSELNSSGYLDQSLILQSVGNKNIDNPSHSPETKEVISEGDNDESFDISASDDKNETASETNVERKPEFLDSDDISTINSSGKVDFENKEFSNADANDTNESSANESLVQDNQVSSVQQLNEETEEIDSPENSDVEDLPERDLTPQSLQISSGKMFEEVSEGESQDSEIFGKDTSKKDDMLGPTSPVSEESDFEKEMSDSIKNNEIINAASPVSDDTDNDQEKGNTDSNNEQTNKIKDSLMGQASPVSDLSDKEQEESKPSKPFDNIFGPASPVSDASAEEHEEISQDKKPDSVIGPASPVSDASDLEGKDNDLSKHELSGPASPSSDASGKGPKPLSPSSTVSEDGSFLDKLNQGPASPDNLDAPHSPSSEGEEQPNKKVVNGMSPPCSDLPAQRLQKEYKDISDEEDSFSEDEKPVKEKIEKQISEKSAKKQNDKVRSQMSIADDHGELDYMDEEEEDIEKADKENIDEGDEKKEKEDGEHDSDKDDGEVDDDDDCEEGEIKEPGSRKPFVKPTCRFFMRGLCTWGSNCRFLHPGVNDKGNYRLFEGPNDRPIQPPWEEMEEEELPPPPPPPPKAAPAETAWERGLRHAKELRKKANKRKEQEPDFEEKKMNLSVDEEREYNKENDRQNPFFDEQVYDDEYYDKVPVHRTPVEPSNIWHPAHYENFEVRWNREPEWIPPPYVPREREHFEYRHRHYSPPPIHRYEKQRDTYHRKEFSDDRVNNQSHQTFNRPRAADQWHDPWQRSKSPKHKARSSRSHSRSRRRSRRSHSYSSSFSSSSFSGSSRSGSRSSSYSRSFSRSSSGSRSSSASSKNSRSASKSPSKRQPVPKRPPKSGQDAPKSTVQKSKTPKSPTKRRPSAQGLSPKKQPTGAGPPLQPLPPGGRGRGRERNPAKPKPPGRKAKGRKRSSSGSSYSRSASSGSSSSRSSSASSISSASSHSSSTSSGSADSEHLYRGVGGKGSSPSPSPKKKAVKKKKPQPAAKKPSPRIARRSSRGDGKAPQGPGLTSKAKDMLKVTGQKPNIKLTLLGNKKTSDKTMEPPAAGKKRQSDSKGGPPAKRQAVKPPEPIQNVPAPKVVKAKQDKQKSIVAAKPIQAPVTKAAPQKTPISPTKAPAKQPAAQVAAQKEKKSTTNRREELLKQLKAVEDAIARKRSKMQ